MDLACTWNDLMSEPIIAGQPRTLGVSSPKLIPDNDNDAAVVIRLRYGNLAALEELVESYNQRVVNFAARILEDATEAQDIAQNVFIQVYRAAHRFHFRCRVSTWIFTITRNLCLNELRRRGRHRVASLDYHSYWEDQETRELEDKSGYGCPRSTAIKAELFEKIEEALAALPERQRTAILLLREGDISYREIASILETTVPATKALIHCGRKELKQKLLPYLQGIG